MSNDSGMELVNKAWEQASILTAGIKNDEYGDPLSNHENIGIPADAFLRIRRNRMEPLTPVQSISLEILKKIARIEATPNHEDSWIDIVGYAACGYSVAVRYEKNGKWETKEFKFPNEDMYDEKL